MDKLTYDQVSKLCKLTQGIVTIYAGAIMGRAGVHLLTR